MQTTTILYIIPILLLSISVAFFQYFYKNKDKRKINILLFFLKTLSLFLIGLLLLNPSIKQVKTTDIKPVLAVLLDNSKSTAYFKQETTVKNTFQKLRNHKELNNKFEVRYFSFGNSLKVLDSLSFTESQTNIALAVSSVNELYNNTDGAVLLLSDGNQTIGNDYAFINSKKAIFPLVIGDTTHYKDLKITQLNVNKYSYIKNKFPVEALLYYEGNETVNTQFSIYYKGKSVFSQKLTLTPTANTQTITANLTANKEGLQFYTASIKKLADEKNLKNNRKSFSVEVINEQSKVLLLSSVLHPDLGALKKAIESNKQQKVTLALIDAFKGTINDYQLVILYNPNEKFKAVFNQIKNKNHNYILISGANTNWTFLNKQQLGFSKNNIHQTENYGAVFNDGFLPFHQKNIRFSQFPPLKDLYGEVHITKPHQTLLYQQVKGINTQQPLLITSEINSQKMGVLFGEGIWKWRASSFLQQNSFQDFDAFIGNLVQYLASNKKRNRLTVTANSIYLANSTITINAFYVDKNYQFDTRATLWLSLTHTDTKETKKLPFSLVHNAYQLVLENEKSGNYSYKVTVDKQLIQQFGKFKITDYQVEEQFTNANATKLQKLADKTKGTLFYIHQEDILIDSLVKDRRYFTTQKSTVKEQQLIDWKYVLFLIVALLSAEWFVRKYMGLI